MLAGVHVGSAVSMNWKLNLGRIEPLSERSLSDVYGLALRCMQERVRTLQDLVAAVSTRGVTELDLQGSTISAGTLGDEEAEMIVFTGSSTGARVRNGWVSAPRHGAILLEGCGAHFQDIIYSGELHIRIQPPHTVSHKISYSVRHDSWH